jgi:hypothetical protein
MFLLLPTNALLPPVSDLYSILSSRAVFSSVQRRLSIELLDENNIVSMVQQFENYHNFTFLGFTTLCFSLGLLLIYIGGSNPSTFRIRKWSDYSIIEKRVNTFIFVFMLIMSKNIENAI